MDNLLKSVYDLPDISFIENDSLDAMMQRLVSNYEKRYKEVTGKTVSLGAADPVRVQLYAIALDLYQIEQYVDRAGKQDLLKYSYGGFLDNLAGTRGSHPARGQPGPDHPALHSLGGEALRQRHPGGNPGDQRQ